MVTKLKHCDICEEHSLRKRCSYCTRILQDKRINYKENVPLKLQIVKKSLALRLKHNLDAKEYRLTYGPIIMRAKKNEEQKTMNPDDLLKIVREQIKEDEQYEEELN